MHISHNYHKLFTFRDQIKKLEEERDEIVKDSEAEEARLMACCDEADAEHRIEVTFKAKCRVRACTHRPCPIPSFRWHLCYPGFAGTSRHAVAAI